MKKYLLFILVLINLLILTYGCLGQKVKNVNHNEWVSYKVQENKDISNIQILPINLGEFSMKIKFDNCSISNDSITAKGVVTAPGKLGMIGEKDVQIYVCNILNQKIFKDFIFLSRTDKNGKFSIKYKRTRQFGILFIKKNQSSILVSNIKTIER